ncbi:hypothetical protein [Paracoccus laeviglucosivorans]|uniref:Uncharacterized protein n=1 Tax=Paracoccus laeviglucosivorans TaxID=1197861 RepID=A0A521DIF5_9RHOB|nr:hypothetical protein [Paracoccus laeviglucosivorans]SMO70710.1 hypothetical protein SAMN06265221_10829 [Paracoccus laeviglucosivorans]
MLRLFPIACILLVAALPLAAQIAPTLPAAEVARKPDCADAAHNAQPATQESASSDATAPENSGSSGWSGGTGGSHIGTNPSGATQHTKSWQPPTARGLDLTGRPEPAPAAC